MNIENKDGKMYIVKTLRVMNYLVRGGFDVIRLMDDDNNPKYKVFAFRDSVELREYLKQYKMDK